MLIRVSACCAAVGRLTQTQVNLNDAGHFQNKFFNSAIAAADYNIHLSTRINHQGKFGLVLTLIRVSAHRAAVGRVTQTQANLNAAGHFQN